MPTFEPPPVSPTPAASPVPTQSTPAAEPITADNAADLEEVSSGQFDEPFQRLTWRGDGQAAFVVGRQSVAVAEVNKQGLTPVLSVAEPAYILDVSSAGVAAVADDVHTISLRETGNDSVIKTLTIRETLTAATFSPDGRILAVTLADEIVTQLWDVETGAKVEDLTGFETAAPVYAVEFGPAGRSLIWHARATAQVMDLVTAQLGPAVSEEDFLSAVALSPIEKVLATTAGTRLSLWDLDSGDTIDVATLSDVASDLAYTPDGKLLFVSSAQGVSIFQLSLLTPHGGLDGDIQAIAVSPDGDALATVGRTGLVTIYMP